MNEWSWQGKKSREKLRDRTYCLSFTPFLRSVLCSWYFFKGTCDFESESLRKERKTITHMRLPPNILSFTPRFTRSWWLYFGRKRFSSVESLEESGGRDELVQVGWRASHLNGVFFLRVVDRWILGILGVSYIGCSHESALTWHQLQVLKSEAGREEEIKESPGERDWLDWLPSSSHHQKESLNSLHGLWSSHLISLRLHSISRSDLLFLICSLVFSSMNLHACNSTFRRRYWWWGSYVCVPCVVKTAREERKEDKGSGRKLCFTSDWLSFSLSNFQVNTISLTVCVCIYAERIVQYKPSFDISGGGLCWGER